MGQDHTDPEIQRHTVRVRSIWKRILTGIAAFLFAGFLLLLFLLKSQMMSGWRQQTGAMLAKLAIGVEAEISGNVQFDLFPEFSAEITGLAFSFEPDAQPEEFDQTIGKLGVSMPYSVLMGAGGLITSLEIAETQLRLDAMKPGSESPAPPEDTQTAPFVARLPSILLGPDFVRDVSLRAMAFNFVDPVNGWSQEITLENGSWKEADGDRIQSKATGKINDVPVSMTLDVDSKGANRNLSFVAVLPGLDLDLEGTIDPTNSVADIDVVVTGVSESLGELASIFEIRADVAGNAKVSLHLAGPLTQLDMNDLDLWAATDQIAKFTIEGQVFDLSSPRDVRLDFDTDLVLPGQAEKTENPSLLDFSIEGLAGSITGHAGKYSLEDGTVRTNLATVSGDKIGPISVGQVVKDKNNRVGLTDVHVQYGPVDHPRVVVTGNVGDILALSGMDLSGHVEIPVAEFLERREISDPDALGILTGTLSVTDDSGAIKVKELHASVTGNDLIDLKIFTPPQSDASVPGSSVSIKLAAPDLRDIATLLGNEVDETGPLAFDGTVTLADATATIDAEMSFLDSDVYLDITTHEADSTAVVDGSIKATALDTADVAALIDTFRDRTGDTDPSPATDNDDDPSDTSIKPDPDLWSLFRASVSFDVEKLLDGDESAGNLSGLLNYVDKKLDLTGMSVTFLGGTITGDYSADFTGERPSLAANGKVDKWRLGTILSDFVAKPPVTGTLYLTYDVTASGATVGQMVKTLTGTFYASLWSGTVHSRLLDLTGLNLVTWLFGKGSEQDRSKLVCARLPMHFNNGTATSNSLIIETENVQIVGGGAIDLKNETLNLSFVPRAKVQQAIEIASPFSISGTFSSPKVALQTPAAARVVGETLALPFNILGQIVTQGASKPTTEKPCTLPKSKPK